MLGPITLDVLLWFVALEQEDQQRVATVFRPAYRLLLEVYNRAAVKANEAGAGRFVFDGALVQEVSGFTGELQ